MAAMLWILIGSGVALIVAALAEKYVPNSFWEKWL